MIAEQWLHEKQEFKLETLSILCHLIGLSIEETTAILQGNTASPIVVVAVITGAALSTSSRTVNDVSETRTWRVTGFSADLVVTVF